MTHTGTEVFPKDANVSFDINSVIKTTLTEIGRIMLSQSAIKYNLLAIFFMFFRVFWSEKCNF